MAIEIGGETFHQEPNLREQIAYRDTWLVRSKSLVPSIEFGVLPARPNLSPALRRGRGTSFLVRRNDLDCFDR